MTGWYEHGPDEEHDDGLERIRIEDPDPALTTPRQRDDQSRADRTERAASPFAELSDDEDDDYGLDTQHRRRAVAPGQDEDDLEQDDDEWEPSMGFPDPQGVLRVWLDDEGVLERVRLSLHWRSRLGDHPLEDAFDFAFLLVNNFRRERDHRLLHEPEEQPALEPLSWEAMSRIRGRRREIHQRLSELGEAGATAIEGHETVGTGARGKVRLGLDLDGLIQGVRFDQAWLEQARAREIGDAVVEAHRDAVARYEPPEVELGERERLVNELTGLRNELTAMMRRGFA